VNEKDFVSEEPVEVIVDGKKFLIKELSGTEYDALSNKYISVDQESGNINADLVKRNEYYLTNCVIDAPYDLGGKAFKDLNPMQKKDLLNKLKPKIRIRLVRAIAELNDIGSDVAKNLKKQL